MLLYQQIRCDLQQMLADQPALKKLPSERTLQDKYNSTRITIREALSKLEAEGVIYRQNRKGWFICPPRFKWDPVQKVNFYQFAQEQNFSAKTALISLTTSPCNSELMSCFSLTESEPAYCITRMRSLDERPVMVEEIYCLSSKFDDLQSKALDGSVTSIFERDYGVEIAYERSTLIVTATPEDKANLLNLSSGSPCLKIIRSRYAKDDTLVDHNIEYWVHGAIEISVQSNRF
ncbi:UTRA domain-containing protein [Psychrobium sp. MM17-31]|uniref:UTRA domain-containing protein n=1 Tax=Psychrobium sp. MM17-31 TaxID=2917758 RepID=UPI001EF4A571|nr:UTRA domain-containing protein [Psychrobium sp. MM17-31]MCG7530714.1 UTRA domain-containing protein [Psychrobium sp. MM17-31]